MKKRGFTLAEVLIAMALVGVIAALTVPTFISNSRNKANAAKLASTVNAVESAFQTMMASQAEDDFTQTTFGQNRDEASLGEFLKINGDGANFSDLGYENNAPFTTLSNAAWNEAIDNNGGVFLTKNGAVVALVYDPTSITDQQRRQIGASVVSSIGKLVIDVNGAALPNKWGRDAFYFRIGDDGMLYPAGSLNYAALEYQDEDQVWRTGDNNIKCDNGTFSIGCTARLIEKNYEVDY